MTPDTLIEQTRRELLLELQTLYPGATPKHKIDTVLSPYRINPLGAHVDHQGGSVLAQTIDQYTVMSFTTLEGSAGSAPVVRLKCLQPDWSIHEAGFKIGETQHEANWVRYAQAAAAALAANFELPNGLVGVVDGTLVGAGLSSSASVVLAYLKAIASCNNLDVSQRQLVEYSRRVENDYLGLNNGIQDQMSIVYGRHDGLCRLDMLTGNATPVIAPKTQADSESVAWVLLYSGYSRELINSGFNTRVQECREAAQALQQGAQKLGDVDPQNRSDQHLATIDPELAKRARHFISETGRVAEGSKLWQKGDWAQFGNLMNESCKSSIEQYESGSQALIDAHAIALTTSGVLGSRFGGGGYGGCLIMLCDASAVDTIARDTLQLYLQSYPDREGIARSFVARPVDGLQILSE